MTHFNSNYRLGPAGPAVKFETFIVRPEDADAMKAIVNEVVVNQLLNTVTGDKKLGQYSADNLLVTDFGLRKINYYWNLQKHECNLGILGALGLC